MDKIEEVLKRHLNLNEEWAGFHYSEHTNTDAINGDDWLKNHTSYIYKVGVLTAIDNNKCDWIYVAIGTMRGVDTQVDVVGVLHFREGENDDVARVIDRAIKMLPDHHPVFGIDQ